MIDLNSKGLLSIFLVVVNIFIFINYRAFIFAFCLLSCFIIFKSIELISINKFLLKIVPLNYFLNIFFTTFSENPNSSIFWDMQNFLHYLSCNFDSKYYLYKYDNILKECPPTIGYGPLTDFIYFDVNFIWEITILIFFVFIFFSIFLLYKCNTQQLLLVTILISPACHFLLFSLNSDVFVLFYMIYLISKKEVKFNIYNFIFLSLLSQIKIYTVSLFLGYSLVFYIRKQYKKLNISILFFLINAIIIINHYLLESSFIPRPISYTRSFGILHDLDLIKNYIGFNRLIYFFIALLLLVLIFGKPIFKKLINIKFQTGNADSNKILLLLPLVILVNSYQNWGYKYIFSALLIFVIFGSVSKNFQFYLILVVLFSSTYYVIGWGYENTLINLLLIIFSKGLFYSFYICTLLLLNKTVK